LQKERLLLYMPFLGLIVLVIVLYVPGLAGLFGYSGHISFLSDLGFMDKITVLLTFALASFAAIEGFSTFKRTSAEAKRHQIEDARNELEKAYGPLYMILNKVSKPENTSFWLDFEEREKIDDIIATYPFMFPLSITELWQEKIRKLGSTVDGSDLKSGKYAIKLDAYLELKNMINDEYNSRVKNYRNLLEE
jgi:hypothetical protein